MTHQHKVQWTIVIRKGKAYAPPELSEPATTKTRRLAMMFSYRISFL